MVHIRYDISTGKRMSPPEDLSITVTRKNDKEKLIVCHNLIFIKFVRNNGVHKV